MFNLLAYYKTPLWRDFCFSSASAVYVLTLGGIDGMSKVSGDDDAGAILGFLSRVLRLEMHQLRGNYRPHYFQQSPKESGGARVPDRSRGLTRSRPSWAWSPSPKQHSALACCFGKQKGPPERRAFVRNKPSDRLMPPSHRWLSVSPFPTLAEKGSAPHP